MQVFRAYGRLCLAASVAALLCGAPARSGAQSTPDGLGLSQFEAGKSAFDAGDFQRALASFTASLAVMPSPNTRLYIARCQRALGRIASAYTQFKLAAREAQDRLGATGEKRYSATRDAAAGEAAELEARVPRLTVAVPSDLPKDFKLSVGGRPLPRSTHAGGCC